MYCVADFRQHLIVLFTQREDPRKMIFKNNYEITSLIYTYKNIILLKYQMQMNSVIAQNNPRFFLLKNYLA